MKKRNRKLKGKNNNKDLNKVIVPEIDEVMTKEVNEIITETKIPQEKLSKEDFLKKREILKRKQFRDKLNCEKIFLMNIDDKEKLLRLNQWSLEKMYLSKIEENNIFPMFGEIWKVKLGENVGAEMNKTRYCIVCSYNNFNKNSLLSTIIPITNNTKCDVGTHFLIKDYLAESEIPLDGVVKTEMIRTVSKARFCYKIGKLNEKGIRRLKETILTQFDMESLIHSI